MNTTDKEKHIRTHIRDGDIEAASVSLKVKIVGYSEETTVFYDLNNKQLEQLLDLVD